MIKKLLYTGLIILEIMLFTGCDASSVPSVATDDVNEQSTENNESTIYEENNYTEESTTENSLGNGTDIPEISTENIIEKTDKYNIKKIYKKMSTKADVNVRKGPSEDYERFERLDEGTSVNVVGQCVETGWYMIELGGKKGFVSNKFLTDSSDTKLVLGDECPYSLYLLTNYEGQLGWFYIKDMGWQPLTYNEYLKDMADKGYTIETFPVYIGNWRDVGDVMWLGYSKK